MKIERQLLNLKSARIKADEPGRFSGYASVFGGVDSYGDTIAPGAFANTLAERDRTVKMRWNHFGPVIGKWTRMEEDDYGLRVEGELTPGHSVADDVRASLMHGAIDGLSIGFYARGYTVDEGEKRRTLTEIELVEISVVEEPADNAARIADVKSAIESAETIKELEALLRDAGGFSRRDATLLVSRIKAMASRRSAARTDASSLEAGFDRILKLLEN
jgi:uncharacterized protein